MAYLRAVHHGLDLPPPELGPRRLVALLTHITSLNLRISNTKVLSNHRHTINTVHNNSNQPRMAQHCHNRGLCSRSLNISLSPPHQHINEHCNKLVQLLLSINRGRCNSQLCRRPPPTNRRHTKRKGLQRHLQALRRLHARARPQRQCLRYSRGHLPPLANHRLLFRVLPQL